MWQTSYAEQFNNGKNLLQIAMQNSTRTNFVAMPIGVEAQSTLGGHQIFARKICIKNQQNARILHDSARKMPEFYVIIARKIFSPNFRGGEGARAPPRLLPVGLCLQNRHNTAVSHHIESFSGRGFR